MGRVANKDKAIYGNDEYDAWVSGIALKSGYDIRTLEKTIVQPNIFLSYSYIKTDNYLTHSNVYVKYNSLNVFQVAPGLKVLQQLPKMMDVYFDTRYVLTYNSRGQIAAGNLLLPNVEFKAFVEYGVGVQKSWQQEMGYALETALKVNRRDGGHAGWNGSEEIRLPF